MTTISFVTMTWQRSPDMLEHSLWTLEHQTVSPFEFVITEASCERAYHEMTWRQCVRYPFVKLYDAYWSRFNVSRGFNCGISRAAGEYVAVIGSELLFSENFVEVLLTKVALNRMVRAVCGTLPEHIIPAADPAAYRAQWDWYGKACVPYPPHLAPGAVVCAHRDWWHKVRGYDEARRPYSYPDIDIHDRASRSELVDWGIGWEETQVIHPHHPLSRLFYSISGYEVDAAGVDKEVVRNPGAWGVLEGDEPVRIPET